MNHDAIDEPQYSMMILMHWVLVLFRDWEREDEGPENSVICM